jgi:translation initiation factor IF-3
MERDKHFRDLEMIDKVISKEKPKSNERDRETALRLATEDFQHLLEINQQPFAPVVGALDYKRVFETTFEIERRATRLKSNLVLPVIVADKKKKLPEEMDDEHLRVSLVELRQLITSFVTNQVFYGNGSIDAKLQMQAARDLDHVIELSGRISKRADKLQKTGAKTN